MIKKLRFFPVFLFLFSFSSGQKPYRELSNYSFSKGEKLEYRVHYGLITAGVATMEISDKLYKLNNRVCYKIDIHGKTSGIIEMMHKVKDNWGTYVDTASIVPHKSYRFIEEGKYRKNEVVNFNHAKDIASVGRMDRNAKRIEETLEFKVPDNVQDIVSGCYYLRTFDYDTFTIGEIMTINAFFEEENMEFKIKFLGRDKLKTKLGEFNVLVLAPILPANKLFTGDDPIRVYLTDDKNKIPLKIKANLMVGSIEIDLKNYENLRNGVFLTKK
jgi:hypothetical protein